MNLLIYKFNCCTKNLEIIELQNEWVTKESIKKTGSTPVKLIYPKFKL